MNIEEVKNKARYILGNTKFITLIGEENKVNTLRKIIEEDIKQEEIDDLNKILDDMEVYFLNKQKEILKQKDFEYLKNIAEILRSQKVRIDDGVYLENPVFKVTVEGDEENAEDTFYFLTKEGADKFMEVNQTLPIHKDDITNTDANERRTEKRFNVERNKNLELERLIEIIKRNF